jgi:hypothetical protein
MEADIPAPAEIVGTMPGLVQIEGTKRVAS